MNLLTKSSFIIVCMILLSTQLFSQDGQFYHNKEYRYSIEFPKGWEYHIPEEYYHVVRSKYMYYDSVSVDSLYVSLSVMVVPNVEGSTIEKMAISQVKVYKLISKNYKENVKERMRINDIECFFIDVSFTRRNRDRRVLSYSLQSREFRYLISFTGSETMIQKLQYIINNTIESFKILD